MPPLTPPDHESVTMFEESENNSSVTESATMMQELAANSEVIIAAIIPSLFCLALVLGFSILSLLYYFKIRKIHISDAGCKDYFNQEVTYEEIQKSTADNTINREMLKMENNSAYGSKSMCVKDMMISGEDTS